MWCTNGGPQARQSAKTTSDRYLKVGVMSCACLIVAEFAGKNMTSRGLSNMQHIMFKYVDGVKVIMSSIQSRNSVSTQLFVLTWTDAAKPFLKIMYLTERFWSVRQPRRTPNENYWPVQFTWDMFLSHGLDRRETQKRRNSVFLRSHVNTTGTKNCEKIAIPAWTTKLWNVFEN